MTERDGGPRPDERADEPESIAVDRVLLDRAIGGWQGIVDSGLPTLVFIAAYVVTGQVPQAMGNLHPSIAPYELLTTADRPLAVAAANDKLFALLAEGIGRPELARDPRFARNSDRVAHRRVLVAELEDVLREQPADHWFEVLSGLGVPCGPINDLKQAFELADGLGLQPVHAITEPGRPPVRTVAHPITLSRTPATYRTPPPLLPPSPGTSQAGGA